MYRATFPTFASAVIACFALLWGAELVFPKSAASAIVLVAVIAAGVWIVRPGWNLRPARFSGYWVVLFGLLLASAAAAAWFLALLEVPHPYDFSTLNIIAALAGVLVLSGIEELLFRQVMYRWLEQRQVSGRCAVVATALAYALGHLGPIFTGSPIGATFYLLQSAYLIWIGVLLGEMRRATGSWLVPWVGHIAHNIMLVYVLSVALRASADAI
jgi:hypothetical protein